LGWVSQAGAGFHHLFGDPPLRQAALAMAAALLAFGTTESGIFAYADALHRPATLVGLLVAVMGVGSIVGGALSPTVIRRVGEISTIAAGLLALALSLGLLVHPNIAVGLAAMPLIGLGVSFIVVAFPTLMQRRTPQALRSPGGTNR
jgi:MFS family permease